MVRDPCDFGRATHSHRLCLERRSRHSTTLRMPHWWLGDNHLLHSRGISVNCLGKSRPTHRLTGRYPRDTPSDPQHGRRLVKCRYNIAGKQQVLEFFGIS